MKYTFGIGVLVIGAFGGMEARADTTIETFTITGGGISASGTITLQTTATPGVDEIAGITGTFSSTSGGFSGTITGLNPGSYNSTNPTVGLFRWDNLFYPSGSAPGVNGNTPGGTLDDYGMEFMVAGGYTVNLFEKGPAVGFLLDDGITSVVDYRLPVTFAVTAPTEPTITQVLNNYGLIPAGFTNSGIAPGTLFIIKGSDLASATSVSSLESTTGGSVLPTTLNGASVAVTVGGVTVQPAFYYAENIQLALVLPSNTPLGAGTVTVTYNNQTSPPFNVQVVASAFGFAASDGTGSGQGHAQDLSYGYYTYSRSIPPGTTIRMIGSGLGADPTRDNQYVQPTAASAINALAHIYVGGVDANIFYQGPEGFPGVDEIDITVPSNAPTGCFISVVGVTAGGIPTNFLTLPIGNGVCQDPAFGASGSTISSLNGQATVSKGVVFLDESTAPSSNGSGATTSDVALAEFQRYTGSTYGTSNNGTLSIGGCSVQENLTSISGTAGTTTGLDAGTITITGPSGSATLTSEASVSPTLAGEYLAPLASAFIPASGGTFQVTGSGGKDVGPFTTQIIYPNPVLIWTNQSANATISRSSGVTITWSGGEPGTFVIVSGSSSSGGVSGSFTCLAPVSPTQFDVPGYVTAALPAGSGNLDLANYTNYGPFTATGLDTGYALGFVNYGIKATYQ
jgi:uncharacterized protein (TIGR03437 family)